jgi:hypothetical protein
MTITYYSHFEVVLGIITIFGWKISKLTIFAYIINCRFLFDPKDLSIAGIQVMFLAILVGIPLSGKSL